MDQFEALDARIIGISADSVESHAAFKAKYDLPFILLADVEKTVCNAYGVWVEKKMFGKVVEGIRRTTFVIDPEGTVQKVIRSRRPEDHPIEALAALDPGA
jgi:peroxiredoxin Q/BCP